MTLISGIPKLVVEGVAYLHFSHMSIKPAKAEASSPKWDILKVLVNMRNNQTLRHNVIRYSTIETFMPTISGSFQREVRFIFFLRILLKKVHSGFFYS